MRNSDTFSFSNIYSGRLTQPANFNNQRETQAYNIPNKINKEEFIPRETLTSVYGDNYDSVQINMENTEKDTIDYFSKIIDELRNKYNEFNTNINSHFKGVTNKISEVFKLNNQPKDVKDSQRFSKKFTYS